jgi:hypothetical protein
MAENYDDSMKWLVDEIVKDDDDLELAGIFAEKRGYHNKRKNLPADDYSVRQYPDKLGPSDKASAFDMTSKSAQKGDYKNIAKYSKRLLAAGKANDPRLEGWREFFGQTDSDRQVEGWDFFKNESSTSSDTSHNWHVHGSELREFITSKVSKEGFLSVWRGETLDAYKKRGGKFVKATRSKPTTPGKPALLTVDGDLGVKTIKRWQEEVNVKVDGKFDTTDSPLVEAVQKRLKATVDHRLVVDGDFGPLTIRRLQSYLKAPVDGDFGPQTIKQLQRRLNTGHF